MSEPMTNVAIEDVLSSIRRLVSEDARVRPVPPREEGTVPEPAPAHQGDAEAEVSGAGRLVLTPALRVPAEDASAADTAAHDVAEAPVEAEAAFEIEAEAAPMVADAIDSASEGEAAALDHPSDDAVTAEMSDAAPFVLEQPMTPEVEAPVAPHSAAEDALVWEDHHHAEAEPMQVSQDHGQAPEDTAQTAGPAVYLEDEDFVFASSREASPREDEVFDAAPKVAAAAPVPDADDLSDRDILLREDEAILDEETLRELVAEIVRQELQGALGERITRNVRKLVRREIHRALTSQELE